MYQSCDIRLLKGAKHMEFLKYESFFMMKTCQSFYGHLE